MNPVIKVSPTAIGAHIGTSVSVMPPEPPGGAIGAPWRSLFRAPSFIARACVFVITKSSSNVHV